ncbi:uncharacterized protein LOC125545917 [Triticum urartu]|nr:uncharacterized protein LOC119270296 [Triticum dicoccoides]XP_037408191.1 uncharacterized protein LOC119270296 [Triticum dicoccoides]XP_048565930.1 uncharacterized protein LOC125545917 [Triticum urartu]XP_048565931.1 uncharacterized protein LOC125545917 [Triticum urartu]XP_048565932.1 uncharacterized protein LOC125545917 [Triticum urartu]
MDGDGPPPPAASVASVLGDDDLFREILLCLGFPNLLVRAALVSKRWLLHASDPVFLRRFRERNPPRLLGFYAGYPGRYQFVPLPQPPELAALSRRPASSCDGAFARGAERLIHCRNGRLLTAFRSRWRQLRGGSFKHYLLAPLLAGEAPTVLPPAPPPIHGRALARFTQMFLPEDGGRDGITLVNLLMVGRKVYAEVYTLGSGGWDFPGTEVIEIELPHATTFLQEMLPPVHGKAFVVTTSGYTLGLDLATSTFFTLELPVGVWRSYLLSSAKDSGLYLVSADGFQLSVWLNGMTGDDYGAAGWLLVDTFSIHEACTRFTDQNQTSMPQDGDFLRVAAVGDNAEFVFLDYATYGVVLYVHLRSRVVDKVYEQAPYHHGNIHPGISRIHISPFMMMWPPVFPALNRRHDQEQ